MQEYHLVEDRPFILAIDFDGTICEKDFPAAGKPHKGAIEALKEFTSHPKIKIILYTCREDDALKNALDLLTSKGIHFDAVNEPLLMHKGQRKPFADLYLDDKAYGSPDWSSYWPQLQKEVLSRLARGVWAHEHPYYSSK